MGLLGDNVPRGAKILAVKQHFTAISWTLITLESLRPEAMIKQLATEESQGLDP